MEDRLAQTELSGLELSARVNDCFSAVNQRPDLGPTVHSESSRTGHDCRSPGSRIDGVCFTASRRVSLLLEMVFKQSKLLLAVGCQCLAWPILSLTVLRILLFFSVLKNTS